MYNTNRILRFPDAADEADLGGIDISTPRIAPGLYELKVREGKKEPNRDGTKENLNFQLETLTSASSTTGEDVPAGHVLFHTISITPTKKYTADAINRSMAAMCQSAGVSIKAGEFKANPNVLAGKFVTAKVGIQKETNEYAERNTIKGFVVKK